MFINKITDGFVIQTFDTETGKFVSQEFIAGNESDYENKETAEAVSSELLIVDGVEVYLPFDMKQPDSPEN